jgi:hypothetical protein
MDLVNIQDVASVMVFTLQISEGELQVLADTLSYLLNNLDDVQLYGVFGDHRNNSDGQNLFQEPVEAREFVEDTFRELMIFIQENCLHEFLLERFRQWKLEQ